MKKLIAFSLLLLAFAADASILYRGRLMQSIKGDTQFEDGTAYTMTFRLYRLPQGGEPFYTADERLVPLRTDGSFEVLLDDPAIDSAFKEDGASVYVGLTLEGGRELMPRRQILMLPRTVHAKQSNALTTSPVVKKMDAQRVKSAKATITQLSARQLKVNQTQGAVSVQGLTVAGSDTLDLTMGKFAVYGEVTELVAAKTPSAVGETLAVAPADGVAFIYSESTLQHMPSCPGIVRFCRKGDEIASPIKGEALSVRYYSFVTK